MLRLNIAISTALIGGSLLTAATAAPMSSESSASYQRTAASHWIVRAASMAAVGDVGGGVMHVAKHGADDAAPPCDDQGTDLCNAPTTIAKNGADDAAPTCDDQGTDLCNAPTTIIAKNGADDAAPTCDDQGTDLCNAATTIAKHGADDAAPPCDDHGTDLCLTGKSA